MGCVGKKESILSAVGCYFYYTSVEILIIFLVLCVHFQCLNAKPIYIIVCNTLKIL